MQIVMHYNTCLEIFFLVNVELNVNNVQVSNSNRRVDVARVL